MHIYSLNDPGKLQEENCSNQKTALEPIDTQIKLLQNQSDIQTAAK